MDDDKLKDLFRVFEPELTSDLQFMNRLERNLDTVELVKRHNEVVRARSRKAVAVAALVGFLVGMLFSAALPYIGAAMQSVRESLPADSMMGIIAGNYLLVAWCVIGATSVLTALNAYDISFSLMARKESRQ